MLRQNDEDQVLNSAFLALPPGMVRELPLLAVTQPAMRNLDRFCVGPILRCMSLRRLPGDMTPDYPRTVRPCNNLPMAAGSTGLTMW
jgi:hypothetical protein